MDPYAKNPKILISDVVVTLYSSKSEAQKEAYRKALEIILIQIMEISPEDIAVFGADLLYVADSQKKHVKSSENVVKCIDLLLNLNSKIVSKNKIENETSWYKGY